MYPFWVLRWLVLVFAFWRKRVGLKWIIGGMAASTLLAVVLEHTI